MGALRVLVGVLASCGQRDDVVQLGGSRIVGSAQPLGRYRTAKLTLPAIAIEHADRIDVAEHLGFALRALLRIPDPKLAGV